MIRPYVLVLLVAALAAVPRLAAAEPHKLLVMQSEGRADPALRAKIDAAITRLALATEPLAAAGDLTFSDAATAVGCKPDAPSCKDEVLGTLAVDELVITTVNPKPGGVEIAVRRVTKGGASRDATMLLATGAAPDKLDGLAPLFGGPPAAAPPAPASPPAGTEPAVPPPTPAAEPPAPAAPRAADSSTALAPFDQSGTATRRLEVVGMAGGATMVVIGLVLWSAASGVQSDIDKSPTATQKDLTALRDLESKGDTYATAGNVLTLGGLIVGGLATYFYLRDRRAASAAMARVMPTVIDHGHGAGVVVRFGGSR